MQWKRQRETKKKRKKKDTKIKKKENKNKKNTLKKKVKKERNGLRKVVDDIIRDSFETLFTKKKSGVGVANDEFESIIWKG